MIRRIVYRMLLGFTLVGGAWLTAFVTLAVLQAGGVSTALYSSALNITNTGSSDQDDIRAAFSISGAALIDDGFIASDALNTLIHKSSTDIPGMPPTARIQVEGAVQDDGGSITEYTTAAQNATANDVPLLPAAAAVGDSLYFGCDNPCRILTFDVDTAGVGTWTVTWEYWDGDSYEPLANVDDRTTGFTTLGRHTISWDMPTNWATNTVTGSAVNSYWGRGRVSAFTSETTQPLGTQMFYENGQWWTWVEDLDVNNQEQFTVYLGGGTDLVTAHQIFPGTAGIVTADNATIELGGSYSLGYVGRLNFGTTGTTICQACKTGALTLHASGSASSPVIYATLTGGGTTNLEGATLTLPSTGEQTVILASDGTNAVLLTDAGGGLASGGAQTLTNNANSYTFGSNGSTDYIESIRVDAATPTVFNVDTTYTNFTTGTLTNTQAYTGALGLDNQ